MSSEQRPDWVPDSAGTEFATYIRPGINNDNKSSDDTQLASNPSFLRRKELSMAEYIQGIQSQDRTILARAITLIESNSPKHWDIGQQILTQILPHTGRSLRIGISGVPGAGKSTFIESLGCYLTAQGHKVAVLTVDPSSTISKGSVLGDKTRMEKLVQQPNCFIRPSPSGGALGGVARKTRETILICEAAGYEVILIETVGVGQSEIQVRSMVDFFLLINIAGAGDELQGIKKGIMEIADGIAINKADGDNIPSAQLAKSEYSQALHYLESPTPGWKTTVYLCSSLYHQGIQEIWREIIKFRDFTQTTGFFQTRRKLQTREWVHQLIHEYLHDLFYRDPKILLAIPEIESKLDIGELSPSQAVQQLLSLFRCQIQKNLA